MAPESTSWPAVTTSYLRDIFLLLFFPRQKRHFSGPPPRPPSPPPLPARCFEAVWIKVPSWRREQGSRPPRTTPSWTSCWTVSVWHRVLYRARPRGVPPVRRSAGPGLARVLGGTSGSAGPTTSRCMCLWTVAPEGWCHYYYYPKEITLKLCACTWSVMKQFEQWPGWADVSRVIPSVQQHIRITLNEV